MTIKFPNKANLDYVITSLGLDDHSRFRALREALQKIECCDIKLYINKDISGCPTSKDHEELLDPNTGEFHKLLAATDIKHFTNEEITLTSTYVNSDSTISIHSFTHDGIEYDCADETGMYIEPTVFNLMDIYCKDITELIATSNSPQSKVKEKPKPVQRDELFRGWLVARTEGKYLPKNATYQERYDSLNIINKDVLHTLLNKAFPTVFTGKGGIFLRSQKVVDFQLSKVNYRKTNL